jgi:uncharacterized membrane protein YfcA
LFFFFLLSFSFQMLRSKRKLNIDRRRWRTTRKSWKACFGSGFLSFLHGKMETIHAAFLLLYKTNNSVVLPTQNNAFST